MEFNFEEKFILGHQDFLNCCLKLQFGVGSKSICVLVDRSGALYFPIVSDNGDVTIHNVDLRDIRRKNLRITSAYHIEHDGRSYLFVACDAKEGGGYSLITYCTSNYDILKKEKDLVSWQILEIPFKIMDARSLTDDNHNSILLLCGSDKRVHLYLLDAQCIIFKKKKSNLYRNLMVDRFLLLEDKDNECLGTALPIRLFINQNRNVNPCVPDILLGYSNGITIWYHETIFLQNNSNEFDFIQEIPLFQGISNNLNSTTSLESGMSMSRKSRSADDLLKVLEHVVENNSINEDTEIRGKTTDYLNNLDVSLPLASIVEEDSEEESTSGLPSKFPEIVPKMINIEVSQIERKILFFDGILSCSCFYNIPIPITSQNDNMNKNRSISRLNLQTKIQLFIPCVVIGLASGSTLLVQYDDVENPIPILSKSFQHGAVLALAQEFISNNICKDIVSIFITRVTFLFVCIEYLCIFFHQIISIKNILTSIYFNLCFIAFTIISINFVRPSSLSTSLPLSLLHPSISLHLVFSNLSRIFSPLFLHLYFT